ncbi:uncharacterized protein BX664DRAFT_143866 [Halteromyces radiatus]|uniref:uncharacterized protein n=1 Tax=Halteromyces radiatus TaxID=101107 RepID=UPI00221F3169|nr:uncharacterized protein BX664DRAFT_143866 [Halteromyces radiatus]KAI8089888.1 hypothetical protein BX664DRAFT_143866 [Halteromyces radiatus]
MSEQSSPRISRSDSIQNLKKTKDFSSAPPSPSLKPQKETTNDDSDDVPTAVVIKNIPFSLKKDALLFIMNANGVPLPYALNYHFDNGVFRGLAFANFRNTEETMDAMNGLNGLEIGRRKLRVEFKKPLLFGQPSVSSRDNIQQQGYGGHVNDSRVTELYEQLLMFCDDPSRESFTPETYSGRERKDVHLMAEKLGLLHHSVGIYPERQVQVRKKEIHLKATTELDNVNLSPKPSLEYSPDSRPLVETFTKRESGLFRKSFNQTSNSNQQQDTILYPFRQPRGPDLTKNFESRKNLQQLSLSDILLRQRMANVFL